MLVATIGGRLQGRDESKGGPAVRSEVDLAALVPARALPPEEAQRW